MDYINPAFAILIIFICWTVLGAMVLRALHRIGNELNAHNEAPMVEIDPEELATLHVLGYDKYGRPVKPQPIFDQEQA